MALEDLVRAELLAIRKTAAGLTVAAVGSSPVISGLLGNGDPRVAYNALKHAVLRADPNTALDAAVCSLGLTSDKYTHLGRLEDFGAEHGYDQRQVRRYSDRGVRQLAGLISTSWATISVPRLDVTVVQTAAESLACHVQTAHHYYIEMRQLSITVRRQDASPHEEPLSSDESHDGPWLRRRYTEGLQLAVGTTSSFTFVWAGELWPKYSVQIVGDFQQQSLVCESLGSKLMLTFSPLARTRA